jgi:hypothetical protein
LIRADIDGFLVIGRKARRKETTRKTETYVEDNIKMELLEIGLSVVDWMIWLRIGSCERGNELSGPIKCREIYRVAAKLVASRAVLSSIELVSYLAQNKSSLTLQTTQTSVIIQ